MAVKTNKKKVEQKIIFLNGINMYSELNAFNKDLSESSDGWVVKQISGLYRSASTGLFILLERTIDNN